MAIEMTRVDERLIHGQMALAWLRAYPVDAVIVIDDESARDDLKSMLLEMAAGSTECIVCEEKDALDAVNSNSDKSLFICTGKVSSVLHLLEQGVEMPVVNIGGIYDKAGRTQLFPTIFVNDEIKADILALEKFPGCTVEHRQVPQNKPEDIIAALKKQM